MNYWIRGKRLMYRLFAIINNFIIRIVYGPKALTVICPICHWRGTKFIDFDCGFGNIYVNAECPWCHSHPRHRLLYFLLKQELDTPLPIRLLHFAPEKCIERIIHKYNNITYLTADIDPGKAMQQENIEKLSFPSNCFDITICLDVLEHVKRDDRALNELKRTLKRGGVCIIDVPVDPSRPTTYQDSSITSPQDRAKAYWQEDHLRLYGRNFPIILKKVGFYVKQYKSPKTFTKKDIAKFGLPTLPLYLCHKKL